MVDELPTEVTLGEVCVAYKQVFGTPEGQIVLADLVHKFGFTRRSTLVSGEPDRSAAQEGQRTVMIHIGGMLDADPAALNEQRDQEQARW